MTEERRPFAQQRRRPPTRSFMQRALALLARREHSRAELRSKLLRGSRMSDAEPSSEAAGATQVQQEVDHVLDQLVAQNLLSDARFVHARVRVRAQRYGVARIKQELQRYGLENDLVHDSLKSLVTTEFERAWALWSRTFGCAPADAPQRAKQLRFLAARGFSVEIAFKVLKEADAVTKSNDSRSSS